MTYFADNVYRLKLGHVSYSNIMTDDSAIIINFPVQSDQVAARLWQRPDNESDVIDDAAELTPGMDHYTTGQGLPEFTWKMRGLTPLMVKYLKDTFFSSGDVWSVKATVAVPNRESGATEVYQTIMTRQLASSARTALGGLDEWTLDFINCILVPEGAEAFTSGFTVGFQ